MRDKHEPREEFVTTLEEQIGREVRRRNRVVQAPAWAAWSGMKLAAAAATLVLISMTIGAGVVVAAYEAQGNERRDQFLASFEQRASLARKRLEIVTADVQGVERKVSVGMASNADLLDVRFKVAEALAEVKSLDLQMEEIRLSAREPRMELSAPRVSGRDFVSERLRAESAVPQGMVGLEEARVREAERRVSVGVADAAELEAARARLIEATAALEAVQKKLEVRQRFLGGLIDAVETELRALEIEAEQRQKTLTSKVAVARTRVATVTRKVSVGMGQQVEQNEALLSQLQLQTELAKANLDLTLVRRQIDQHRAGK